MRARKYDGLDRANLGYLFGTLNHIEEKKEIRKGHVPLCGSLNFHIS